MINKFEINNAPNSTGVYIFKQNKKVLYVGKAKNIKKRLQQYFNGSKNSYKTPSLLKKTNSFEFIICNNEKEALLLEQELIKKYKPHYNVLLLDDKKYPYIVIELKQNKLEIKTKFFYKKTPNSYYYGPLPPNYGFKTIKNFLIRECMYENGIAIKTKDFEFWKKKFDYAKKILSSSNSEIIKKIKIKMDEASNSEQYELAKDYRDIIFYLTNKNQNQSIFFDKQKDFDVVVFKIEKNIVMINVNNFKSGSFFMNEDFVVEIKIDEYETICSFINNYYSMRNIPNHIVTNFKINENDLLFKINFILPKKGNYLKAIENALKNIEINKEIKILEFQAKHLIIDKMHDFFFKHLGKEINDFIMIDNSNEQNKDVVSFIIYYKNLLPHYSNYRKYKLNHDIKKNSDTEYINKGLTKYFKNQEEVPDLIIVDGSKGQISEAKKVLNFFNLDIPIIGLVKNKKHKTEKMLKENGETVLLKDKQIYNFLSMIQSEVDLLAKKYHSRTKINSSLEGFLISIKGIGPQTEKKLLNHFQTYTKIYNASLDELQTVVPKSIAKKIIKKLKK